MKKLTKVQKNIAVLGVVFAVLALSILYSSGYLFAINTGGITSIPVNSEVGFKFICNVGACQNQVTDIANRGVNCYGTNGAYFTQNTGYFDTYFVGAPASTMKVKFSSAGSATLTCDVMSTKTGGSVLYSESSTITVTSAAPTCTNQCGLGDLQCAGDTGFKRCVKVGDCYQWSATAETCPQNAQAPNYYGCRSGSCQIVTVSPTQTCNAGTFCEGDVAYTQSTTCARSNALTCPNGCSNGACLQVPDEQPTSEQIILSNNQTSVQPSSCADSGYCANSKGVCVLCAEGSPATFDFNAWTTKSFGLDSTTFSIILLVVLVMVIGGGLVLWKG